MDRSLQGEVRSRESRVCSGHYPEVSLLSNRVVRDRDGDALESFDCQTDIQNYGSRLELFELPDFSLRV